MSDKYTLQPFAAIQQARPGDVEAAVAGRGRGGRSTRYRPAAAA